MAPAASGGGLTVARLIDADRALEIVHSRGIAHPNAYHLTNYATLILRESPTVDAVEVTRCRECKYHADTHVNGFEHCCLYGLTMRYNDFCSYGKREEGADNGW